MDAITRSTQTSAWFAQYEFLKSNRQLKLAFPQDDYWFSEIRDAFYVDYEFDAVFPVCPPGSWSGLLPQFTKAGGSVFQGQTAFVTPQMLTFQDLEREWSARTYDVVYRATRVPKVPNRMGHVKGNLGQAFLGALGSSSGLKLNLAGDQSEYFHGMDWLHFLGDSRATLGANSGSSVLLRNRQVFERARHIAKENPDLSIADLEAQIFSPEERNKNYSALAPRNLEAAALGVLQLLTPGDYGGFMKPGLDYFLLNEDCSNALEIADFIRDRRLHRGVIESARASLLDNPNLRFTRHLADVHRFIRGVDRKHASHHGAQLVIFSSRLKAHNRRQQIFERFAAVADRLWSLSRAARVNARAVISIVARNLRARRQTNNGL